MNTKIISYKNFSKVLEIKNEYIRALITIDKGPRIIFFSKSESDENILFEDKYDDINKERKDLKDFHEDNYWHIYGGHRLWKAPEDDMTYYPDNDECKIINHSNSYIEISSNTEKDTKIRKSFVLKLEKNKLHIKNIIRRDIIKQEIAAWSLTVLKPSGKIIIPLNTKDTAYLPNRSINLWSYSSIEDRRLTVNDSKIEINIEEEKIAKKEPLKIGTFLENPKVYYLKDDYAIEFESKYKKPGKYPDYNSNLEIYTIDKMVEVEFLSDLKKRQKEIVLEETWTLFDRKSNEYKEIEKY